MNRAPWVATLLPKDARDALVTTSRIDPKIEAGMSFARAKAVDQVTLRIKSTYPHLFHKGA